MRATGGLRDSVTHLNAMDDEGNGFVFEHFDARGLWSGCAEAMRYWHLDDETRQRIVQRVMREGMNNFNLERTTLAYVHIYEKLLGEPLL